VSERFSERHGLESVNAAITVWNDAPDTIRWALPTIARDASMGPTEMRNVVCETLLIPPDPKNWSPYPYIWDEVVGLIRKCTWFGVYDVAEALYRALERRDADLSRQFSDKLNRVFRREGIGYEMQDGLIVFRGDEVFSRATREAIPVLVETGRARAATEIREALQDISRRPEPDITGAIQHAFAALESTARDVTGEPKPTLGKLVPKLSLPRPLDGALAKLWGYASESARHIREGQVVSFSEAELLVSIAGTICTFLARREHNSGLDSNAEAFVI